MVINQDLPLVPSRPVLSCPVLSCPFLSCPVLSCPVPSRPRSLIDHILAISSLASSATITSLSTSSRLVGIWDGLLVGVRRSSPASTLLYWPKIWIFQVSPQRASLVRSYILANLGGSDPFWYITMSFGERCPMESSLVVAEILLLQYLRTVVAA